MPAKFGQYFLPACKLNTPPGPKTSQTRPDDHLPPLKYLEIVAGTRSSDIQKAFIIYHFFKELFPAARYNLARHLPQTKGFQALAPQGISVLASLLFVGQMALQGFPLASGLGQAAQGHLIYITWLS